MMSELEIERGIPIPPRQHGTGKLSGAMGAVYSLKVDESVFFANGKKVDWQINKTRRDFPERQFTTRRMVNENGTLGTRVWRTK